MPDELFIYFASLTEAALEILQYRTRLNSVLIRYKALSKNIHPKLLADKVLCEKLSSIEEQLLELERTLENHRVYLLKTRDAYMQTESGDEDGLPVPDYLSGYGETNSDQKTFAWVRRLLPRTVSIVISPAIMSAVRGDWGNTFD
ncbi:MAG: hypothetical protein LBQ68_05665 [Clostridiales bacterium]|nr:hypothetical protein [Clostridiales bacterium]